VARKHSKTLPGGFDLSTFAPGESPPLSQPCATEIGICKSNRPSYLPGQFEILCGWARTSPRTMELVGFGPR
jgi:hypothetical protein